MYRYRAAAEFEYRCRGRDRASETDVEKHSGNGPMAEFPALHVLSQAVHSKQGLRSLTRDVNN